VGVGVWAIVRDTGGISVPSVVGKTQAQAKATLAEAGLELEVSKTVRDASQPADVIISQDPAPGSQLQKGGTVKVVVNEGEDLVNVPSVVGLTPAEAEAALEEADLELGDTSESFSTQVAKGKVLSQSPAGGEKTAKGSSVSIVVSKGPESENVPNVVGLSQATATQRLEEAGFQVQVQTQSSSTATVGTVLEQNPAAGESTPKSSTVTITVAEKPPKVPNVVGQLQADAENTLVEAGFVVTVINQATTDQSRVGRVMSQDPPANSEAGPGASVKIYVGVTR
jgi:serine/threonine-protein kinase